MKKALLGFFFIFCFVGASFSTRSHKTVHTTASKNNYQIGQERWADSILSALSLDEKIGQFFMVATYSNRGEDHYRLIEGLIRNQHIGGVIFFQGGPVRQANLTNRYQSMSKVPLFVGIDAEWGLGMRLDSTISYPKQMTLGAIQNNYYVEKMGVEIGRQCRRMGIHLNFAPVVDINSNPSNPVIGSRSFGEERENVAAKGVAYARGLRKSKVLASAKHFPGHGDTDQDSHFTLPAIEHSLSHLHDVELYPFKRLIDDSVGSVMTGHLYVPSMDSRYNMASTLSNRIVTDLLKNELGFQGLTITDALNMKGVTRNLVDGEVDLKAFLAGNDILLYSENVFEGIRKIKQAVLNGQISESEINNRVRKVLMAKYWAGLSQYQYVNPYGLHRDLNGYQARAIKQELFEQAITVVRNESQLLPFLNLDTTSFASVSIGADRQNVFQQTLNFYAKFKHFTVNYKPGADSEMQGILQQASKYKVVVVSVHDINASASRNYGVTYPTLNFIQQLQKKTNVVVCCFGSPYSLRLFNQSKHLVCAYEDATEAQKVVPQILFGGLPSLGRLPVSSGTFFRAGEGFSYKDAGRLSYTYAENVGMSTERLEELDNIVHNGIANRAFPGGQVVIARKGKVIYNKNYGTVGYNDEAVTNETIYDIASVSKVASTLQAIMLLNERQAIDLNERASFYLPELYGTNKEKLQIGDILMHQAGLASFIPFWEKTKSGGGFRSEYYRFARSDTFNLEVRQGLYASQAAPDSLWKWLADSPMNGRYDGSGGFRYLYSDLGLIMLQKVVEKITNQPLDVFVEQNLYEPLGMGRTSYNPLRYFDKQEIAPTENEWAFRGVPLRGTVHDPTAALMGGVAGNAGIFSTANDLAILFQMNLNRGEYGKRNYFLPQTVSHFSQNYTSKSHRGLGWDKPKMDEDKPIVSEFAPYTTYGHSGFTGTVAWIDPENDLIFVFLTNRVYPTISNKITTLKIRKRLHDVVYRAMYST